MRIRDLKLGDKIWECESGINVPIEVISEPEKTENCLGETEWKCLAKSFETGDTFYLSCLGDYGTYGPKLSRVPEYFHRDEERNLLEYEAFQNGWLI